jgi:hypothetical protein
MNRAHLFRLGPPEPRSDVPDSIAAKIQRGSILGGLINLLPPDRLRRFLKAFRVEIHNDVRTGRATFKAEISANTIEELAEQARRAADVRWRAAGAGSNIEMPDREEYALPGEPQTIIGSSFGLCPRQCAGSGHPGPMSQDTPD